MKRPALLAIALAAFTGAALAIGCLPGDTRPPPGSVYVTAAPSEATAHGFATSDGWRITFNRLLVGFGDLDFHDDACTEYGEAHYAKLFDFADARATTPQKVGLAYGLGTCPVSLELRQPSTDAPLGVGVTQDDIDFMNARGSDAFVTDDEGAVLYVVGEAIKGKTTKHFSWLIRQRFDLHDCPASAAAVDAGVVTNLELKGNDAVKLPVSFAGEELFRASADDGAGLRFDAIADADANDDGEVTLDELAKVPAPITGGDTDGGVTSIASLIYLALTPRTVKLGGGVCEHEIHQHHF